MKLVSNYLNGNLHHISKNSLDVIDPSTGEKIAEVVLSNQEDFNQVVGSSKMAFNIWSNFTPLKRSRIISKFKKAAAK